MINKKHQKYYVRALFKNNMADNIDTIKSIFKNKFNINLSLNRNEIYKEKFYGIGSLNSFISNDDIKIYLNSLDIFYQYKENNKNVKREGKVIILTTETIRNKLKDP